MSTVQVTGAKGYDTHILMHSATSTDDVSLYQEFQRNLSDVSRKYGVIDQVKYKKKASKKSGKEGDIMCRRMLMVCTNI